MYYIYYIYSTMYIICILYTGIDTLYHNDVFFLTWRLQLHEDKAYIFWLTTTAWRTVPCAEYIFTTFSSTHKPLASHWARLTLDPEIIHDLESTSSFVMGAQEKHGWAISRSGLQSL